MTNQTTYSLRLTYCMNLLNENEFSVLQIVALNSWVCHLDFYTLRLICIKNENKVFWEGPSCNVMWWDSSPSRYNTTLTAVVVSRYREGLWHLFQSISTPIKWKPKFSVPSLTKAMLELRIPQKGLVWIAQWENLALEEMKGWLWCYR